MIAQMDAGIAQATEAVLARVVTQLANSLRELSIDPKSGNLG